MAKKIWKTGLYMRRGGSNAVLQRCLRYASLNAVHGGRARQDGTGGGVLGEGQERVGSENHTNNHEMKTCAETSCADGDDVMEMHVQAATSNADWFYIFVFFTIDHQEI